MDSIKMLPGLREVEAEYDTEYAAGLSKKQDLNVSLDLLFRHYGIIVQTPDDDTERLPIALREMGAPELQGKVLLDYGCGSAKAAVYFAQHGAEVFGFDISPNAIALGQRRVEVNGVSGRVHLRAAAGGALDYPTNSFDFVFGYEILYYLNGKTPFGPEIMRVLKPGGKAVFCEAFGNNPLLQGVRSLLRTATRTINRTGGEPLTRRQIEEAFGPGTEIRLHPVNLLAMGKRLFPRPTPLGKWAVGTMKAIDRRLLARLPGLRERCGEVVIVATKREEADVAP